MNNKRILAALFLFVLFVPFLAVAQTSNPCTVEGVKAAADKSTTLPQCINQIYRWSLGIGALLALLMTIIGGYYIMTSHGNAEQAGKGKEFIGGAIIGLVLLFVAFLLLRTINPQLVELKAPSIENLEKPPDNIR